MRGKGSDTLVTMVLMIGIVWWRGGFESLYNYQFQKITCSKPGPRLCRAYPRACPIPFVRLAPFARRQSARDRSAVGGSRSRHWFIYKNLKKWFHQFTLTWCLLMSNLIDAQLLAIFRCPAESKNVNNLVLINSFTFSIIQLASMIRGACVVYVRVLSAWVVKWAQFR